MRMLLCGVIVVFHLLSTYAKVETRNGKAFETTSCNSWSAFSFSVFSATANCC